MTTVYIVTPTGRHVVPHRPEMHQMPHKNWQSEERVTKKANAVARAALRQHYSDKAYACGMTIEAYCNRFGVKL